MTIISISLSDDSVESLDSIMEELKLKNRSEAVRTSIKIAESHLREDRPMDGYVEGVLIVTHSNHGDAWLSIIQHRYEKNIKTQLHSHMKDKSCLDVMILSGEAKVISDMLMDVHSSSKANYVKFVKE